MITASGSPAVGQWGARKNNGGGGLSVADGQAASAQIAEIQWAVGRPLVKPSADLWGFVRWATSNPLSTAAAASGSSVDSQTISGGPPLTRQLMSVYMVVDEMVLSCLQPAGGTLSEMAVVSESLVNAFVQTHDAFGPS